MSGTLLSPSELATAANLEILMLLKLQAKFRFHIARKHAFDLKLIMLNFFMFDPHFLALCAKFHGFRNLPSREYEYLSPTRAVRHWGRVGGRRHSCG